MSVLLGQAISLAAERHAEQLDFSGEAYILHPLRVMSAVKAAGFSLAVQLAAVLHDILEDTKTAPLELNFVGRTTYDAVIALTRSKEETYADYFLRCADDPTARIVKYFDILDNNDPKRFHPKAPYERYIKGLAWYHERARLWALPISLARLEELVILERNPIPPWTKETS